MKEYLHLIKKEIQSHIWKLRVFESSCYEYELYIRKYKGDPYDLYLNHVKLRWKTMYKRWHDLLTQHGLVTYLLYEASVLVSFVQHVPSRDQKEAIKFIRYIEKEKLELQYQCEKTFQQLRGIHDYIAKFISNLNNVSREHSKLFPKSWKKFMELDQDTKYQLSKYTEQSRNQETILRQRIQKSLKDLGRAVNKINRAYFGTDILNLAKPIQPPLMTEERERKQDMIHELYPEDPGYHKTTRKQWVDNQRSRRTVQVKPTETLAEQPPPKQRSHLDYERERIRSEPVIHHPLLKQSDQTLSRTATSYYMDESYNPVSINYNDMAKYPDYQIFETPFIPWSIPGESVIPHRFKSHFDHKMDLGKAEELNLNIKLSENCKNEEQFMKGGRRLRLRRQTQQFTLPKSVDELYNG